MAFGLFLTGLDVAQEVEWLVQSSQACGSIFFFKYFFGLYGFIDRSAEVCDRKQDEREAE